MRPDPISIDVRDLASEKLPAGKFPVDPRADFRLHIAPEVRRGIEQHAKADVTVEICGVLVGHWGEDENGPYAAVTNYIRCENAASKFAEVTFTHESWAQINKEMDSRFADARIVGWYHSHPDFGIFLSERDSFIQEHFFSGPGQVAYVIDPVRDLEGVFAWRDGKPKPLPHFWIGNTIRTVEASQRNVAAEMAAQSESAGSNSPQSADQKTRESSPPGLAMIALGLLGVFVLGYLYGGSRSRWDQQMIIEGAVAHFANTKLIREGLEEKLAAERSRLTALVKELGKLPGPDAKLSKDELEEAAKGRKLIHDHLILGEEALARIEQHYGLSDIERAVLAHIAAQKQAELLRAIEATKKTEGDRKSGDSAARADKSATKAPPQKKPAPPQSTDEPPNNNPPTATQ